MEDQQKCFVGVIYGKGKCTMTDANAGDSGKVKCPECGSTEFWEIVGKPPKLVCKKCGREFAWQPPEKPKEKE